MDYLKTLNNFWLRQFLTERGYSMEHSHSDDRAWLLSACESALKGKA